MGCAETRQRDKKNSLRLAHTKAFSNGPIVSDRAKRMFTIVFKKLFFLLEWSECILHKEEDLAIHRELYTEAQDNRDLSTTGRWQNSTSE